MNRTLVGVVGLLLISSAASGVEIAQLEAAHGVFGPERKSLEFCPLDEIFFRFRVNGAMIDADDKCDVDVQVKMLSADGKTVFEHKYPVRRQLSLGDKSFPGYAVVNAAEKAPPGKYTLRISLNDRLNGTTANVDREMTCVPAKFQVLGVRFWRDPEGKIPAPAGGQIGESVHLKLRVVGFDTSKKKVQTTLTLILLDERGQPVGDKPKVIKAELNSPEDVAKATQVSFNSMFYLNRPGNFTLRLKVDDLEGGQTTIYDSPLKVTAP